MRSASMVGLALLVGGLLLGGCSSTLQQPDPVLAQQPTPHQVAGGQRVPAADALLTWAGVVQAVRNHPQATEIEILAYPANSAGHPLTGRASQGRFVASMQGYIEPLEVQGAAVTVKGRLLRVDEGRVGESRYRYPVLQGERLEVWHELSSRGGTRPGVRWSLGVGTHGSGVGVGLGF